MCKKKKNYNLFFLKIIIKNNQIPNKALREIKGQKKKKKEKRDRSPETSSNPMINPTKHPFITHGV